MWSQCSTSGVSECVPSRRPTAQTSAGRRARSARSGVPPRGSRSGQDFDHLTAAVGHGRRGDAPGRRSVVIMHRRQEIIPNGCTYGTPTGPAELAGQYGRNKYDYGDHDIAGRPESLPIRYITLHENEETGDTVLGAPERHRQLRLSRLPPGRLRAAADRRVRPAIRRARHTAPDNGHRPARAHLRPCLPGPHPGPNITRLRGHQGVWWARKDPPPCQRPAGAQRMRPGSGACRRYPPQGKEDNMEGPRLEYTAELLRHFADLRDGTHGGAISRQDKERLFTAAVALLDPYALQPLEEININLLLGTGEVTATGVRRSRDGSTRFGLCRGPNSRPPGSARSSSAPITARELTTRICREVPSATGRSMCSSRGRRRPSCRLRAVASADLHNLVFQRDYRIIPAIVNGWKPEPGGSPS